MAEGLEVVKAYEGDDDSGFMSTFKFGKVQVVFASDGRSVHGFVTNEDGICGATWLFNLIPPADEPEWEHGHRDLYMNPATSSKPFDLDANVHQAKLHAHRFGVVGGFVYVLLYDFQPIGRVWDGATPGDSVSATIPTPMAGVTPENAFTEFSLPFRPVE